jgi:hypothetical protein
LVQLRFKALLDGHDAGAIQCSHVGWAASDDDLQTEGSDALEAKFGREGMVSVVVSRPLKKLEHRILNSPDDPISGRLSVNNTQAADAVNGLREWPRVEAVVAFLAARRRYFEKLLAAEKLLLSQAADFGALRQEITSYAERYQDLVTQCMRRAETLQGDEQSKAMEDLQKVLALDTIDVELTDHRGDRR